MPKYIFSNGTVRVTTGLPKPRRVKGTKELSSVIIVFPNPVANQSEQEKEGEKDDKPRTVPEN
jgi:hypothetical protein